MARSRKGSPIRSAWLLVPSKLSSWYKGRRVHRDQCQAGHLRAGRDQCLAGRVHLVWTPPKRTFNIARASNKKRPRSKGSCRTTRHGNRQECGATFGKFDTNSGTTASDSNGNATAALVEDGGIMLSDPAWSVDWSRWRRPGYRR